MARCDETQDLARLRARARAAYEIGGVRRGLRLSWPVVPLVLLALGCCQFRPTSLALGALLWVTSVGLVALGGAAGRAVRPGLLAGGACALLPLGARLLHLCSLVGCRSLLPFCLYGGLIAGAALGYQAGRLAGGRPLFVGVAGGIAALSGSLGCALAGLSGLLGMALGVLCASAPIFLATRARWQPL